MREPRVFVPTGNTPTYVPSTGPKARMSNQTDHRKSCSKRNKRRNERPVPACSCSGEGRSGQKGRSVWKKLSRRSERRALANNKEPKVKKFIRKTYPVPEHTEMRSDSNDPVWSNNGEVRKTQIPKPKLRDQDNDTYYDNFQDGRGW